MPETINFVTPTTSAKFRMIETSLGYIIQFNEQNTEHWVYYCEVNSHHLIIEDKCYIKTKATHLLETLQNIGNERC